MSKKRYAQLISRVLGPFITIPFAVGYFLFFHTKVSDNLDTIFVVLFFFTAFIMTGGVLVYSILSKKISDTEIYNRTERIPVLLGILPGIWLTVILSYLYKKPELFLYVVLAGAISFTVLTFITLYDKVSLHAGGLTVLYMVINIIFEWNYWYVAVAIALMWWARRELSAHSHKQLLIGTLIPIIIFLTLQTLMLQ